VLRQCRLYRDSVELNLRLLYYSSSSNLSRTLALRNIAARHFC
jgi:hypothetical protein